MIALNSIIEGKPDAVFVRRIGLKSIAEMTPETYREIGRSMARALFRSNEDAPDETLVIKPNITGGPREGEKPGERPRYLGEATDPNFVGGVIDVFRDLGMENGRIKMIEGRSTLNLQPIFEHTGFAQLAQDMDVELINNSRETYREDELHWIPVPEGVVFKEIPIVRPTNDPDAKLIGIAKMKTHGLAVATLTVKNMQGLVAYRYKHFCQRIDAVEQFPPELAEHFRPNLREVLEEECRRHSEDDPEWDMWDEIYAHRACDSLLALDPFVSIVEGVVGRWGTGYRRAQDALGNLVVVGRNPVHVDTITAYLMGHTPARLNYLRVAHERGFGENDPGQIETYLFDNDEVAPCDPTALDRLELGVYRKGNTSNAVLV